MENHTKNALEQFAESVKENGLYVNFENNDKRLVDDIEDYFKPASNVCSCFRYTNPANPDLKNSIVKISPSAFDLVEVVDRKWFEKNLLDYFKKSNLQYKNMTDKYASVLCVSKLFKQIVLLEPKKLSTDENDRYCHIVVDSHSKLDGSGADTRSLEYSIIDSMFYRKDRYYNGNDWGTEDNTRSNYAIIGYSTPYYNLFMYSFHSDDNMYITNFSNSSEGLIKDYMEIAKFNLNRKMELIKHELEYTNKQIENVKNNIPKCMMEIEVFGI